VNSLESSELPAIERSESMVPEVGDMLSDLNLGSDSESDNDEDEFDHKKWCQDAVSNLLADPDTSKASADFQGWLMFTQPEKYGPDKETNVSKEDYRAAKKEHDFKKQKDSGTAPWAGFLSV